MSGFLANAKFNRRVAVAMDCREHEHAPGEPTCFDRQEERFVRVEAYLTARAKRERAREVERRRAESEALRAEWDAPKTPRTGRTARYRDLTSAQRSLVMALVQAKHNADEAVTLAVVTGE